MSFFLFRISSQILRFSPKLRYLRFFLFRISSQIWRFSQKLRYLRFFLFRISSQIWRFSQKLRFSFLKGFQAKKGLVLHVLCQSHPCASLARTVLKPLRFLAKKMASLALTVLKPSHAIDLLPSWSSIARVRGTTLQS